MVVYQLLDQLFIPSVHRVHVVLLFSGESIALPVKCLLNPTLNVFVETLNLRIGLPEIALFVPELEFLLTNLIVLLLESQLVIQGKLFFT